MGSGLLESCGGRKAWGKNQEEEKGKGGPPTLGMGMPDLPGSGKMMEMAETLWQTRAQRTENYRPLRR